MEKTVVLNDGRKELTINWFIENYSYCLYNNGAILASPEFTFPGFEYTEWCLDLYPRGNAEESRSNISLFLSRYKYDRGPELFPLKYELSILAPDGSVLKSKEFEYTFKSGDTYGTQKFVQIDEVLFQRKEIFLPQDILSIRCRMWKGDGNAQSVSQMNAVTRIGIEHVSYLHVVDGFSGLKSNEKNTVAIISPSNGVSLTSSLYFDDSSCEKVIVEIKSECRDDILCKCNFFLLDTSGEIIESCKADTRFDGIRADIKKSHLSLSKIILERKSKNAVPVFHLRLSKTIILEGKIKYFPDDKFSLLCECTFHTVVEKRIINTLYHLPLVTVQYIKNNDQYKDAYNAAEKLSACSSALDDLKSIYNNAVLSDVKLETKTKSFPAHKVLLCARSSVFKAMLTNEMKENYTDCIRVDDLENDTVHHLLLFLYSDNLENLQWESAIKLYYAGDKYAIERLKGLCSTFLVNNISTSNASELLLLADTHNDSDLRKSAENFILEHEEEVYSSDEWERLIDINPRLVINTMHLKYKGRR